MLLFTTYYFIYVLAECAYRQTVQTEAVSTKHSALHNFGGQLSLIYYSMLALEEAGHV